MAISVDWTRLHTFRLNYRPMLTGTYGDAMMELDHSVGRILQTLRDNDLTNTLVFFSSDNGAALVDKGHGGYIFSQDKEFYNSW